MTPHVGITLAVTSEELVILREAMEEFMSCDRWDEFDYDTTARLAADLYAPLLVED